MYEHNSHLTFYRKPFGAIAIGQRVRLRFFAPVCTKAVFLCLENKEYAMKKEGEMCGGSIFSISFSPKETCFYTFRAEGENGTAVYGNGSGLGGQGRGGSAVPYQITVYTPVPLPKAYAEGCVYQIFPDRFCPGGPRSVCGIERAWGEVPYYKAEQFGGTYTCDDFFGGTLWGVAEKLPYIKEMGFEWIYLNPVFDSSSNHGYNTKDYRHIAPHLGGDAAFFHLAAAAKAQGMHLILDGVFSHTGADSPYFQSAISDVASPYRAWYTFTDVPPYYEAWWGIPSLPNVREETPSYMEFMLGTDGVVRHWLKNGADGWRLDVADELPDGFLDGLRAAVKAEKENAVILGEVWEDASNKVSYGQRRRYLTGRQLDSATNYPLRAAILDFVRGYADAHAFSARVTALAENYPPSALVGALSFLSGHDVPRVLTMLGDAPGDLSRDEQAQFRLSAENREKAVRRLRLAVVLLVALPGVPCVFYGDEAGMEGYGDPFCRSTYPWGREEKRVIEIYKAAMALRKRNRDFVYGRLAFWHAADQTVGFLRGKTAVLVNAGDREAACSLDDTTVFVPPMAYKIWHTGEKEDADFNAGYYAL